MPELDDVLAENRQLSAAIEQRTAELAVVNAVQQALAAELDMQGIYDAVGDKIREIFDDADLSIRILDPDTGLVEFTYIYDRGERITVDPIPVGGIFAHIFETGATLVISENFDAVTRSSARRLCRAHLRTRSPGCGFRSCGATRYADCSTSPATSASTHSVRPTCGFSRRWPVR